MTEDSLPQFGEYTISTDRDRLDINVIHKFLSTSSYWAQGIPVETIERSIKSSLCFGVFHGSKQVGFARVITDYATWGVIADVFVVEEHRGRGLSKRLMDAIMKHPDLQGLRSWVLATKDAHGLYSQFGFAPLKSPEWFMAIQNPGMYLKPRD